MPKSRFTPPPADDTIFVDVYNTHIGIYYEDSKELMDWGHSFGLNMRRGSGSEATSWFVEDPDGIIWHFIVFHKPLTDIPTIAHECIHIANGILECHGIEVNTTHDEALCYLQMFIFKTLLVMMSEKDKIDLSLLEKKPAKKS